MSRIALVVAMADNGVIGACGTIPWRIPEDMRHFKAVTLGKPCIMGRRTWDSLSRKPLPGRRNIVITRDRAFRAAGAEIVHTLDDALAIAQRERPTEIAVIGGGEIYREARAGAGLVHLTEVHRSFEGDTTMPPFDRTRWREFSREDHSPSAIGGIAFSFVTLERKSG